MEIKDDKGHNRRCADTCASHETQVSHIQALEISVVRLITTVKNWGSIFSVLVIVTMGISGFLSNKSIDLISTFLIRIENLEIKVTDNNRQIIVNTDRLDSLESWRERHTEEDKKSEIKVSNHDRKDERRWGIINKKVINTDKKEEK